MTSTVGRFQQHPESFHRLKNSPGIFSVELRNVKRRQSFIDLVAGRKMTSLPELITHIDFSQWAEP